MKFKIKHYLLGSKCTINTRPIYFVGLASGLYAIHAKTSRLSRKRCIVVFVNEVEYLTSKTYVECTACSVGQFSTKLLHTHATKSTVNCFYDPLPFPKSVQPYTVVSILLLNCFPYCSYNFTNSFPSGKPSFYTRYSTHIEDLSGLFILIFKFEKYSIYCV